MGCLIISAGVALCLCLDFGAGIMDNLILMIGDIFNKTYAFGCYICYAVFFTVGLLLGGVWGYATVVAAARASLNMGNEAVVNTGYTWVTKKNLKTDEVQKILYSK